MKALESREWAIRGSFNVEELAALCGVKPVTIRRWRSLGRNGVLLMPTNSQKHTDKSDLYFTAEAVQEFYEANADDLVMGDALALALEEAAAAQQKNEARKKGLSRAANIAGVAIATALGGPAIALTGAAGIGAARLAKNLLNPNNEDYLSLLKQRRQIISQMNDLNCEDDEILTEFSSGKHIDNPLIMKLLDEKRGEIQLRYGELYAKLEEIEQALHSAQQAAQEAAEPLQDENDQEE